MGKKVTLCFLTVLVLYILSFKSFAQRSLFLQVKEPTPPTQTQQVVEPPRTDVNYLMQTFWLNYVSAKEMKDTIKDILAPGEGVSFNNETNSIVVRSTAKNLERIAKVIEKMDKPPLQVNVEAKILELKRGSGDTSNPSTLGFSWKYTRPSNTNDFAQFFATNIPTMGAISQGLYAQVLTGNVAAYLQALEKSVGYDFIASPWISTLNHKEAEILIGGKLGYQTLFTSQTGTLQEVQYIDIGTKLKFIPHIAQDGYIKMEIYPSLTDGMLVNGIPQTTVTETKNHVLVKDGQTIVIGGLTRSFKNEVTIGVPILSNIPFLGSFFRRKEIISEKRDLMVLITPRIVTAEFLKSLKEKSENLQNKQGNLEQEPLELFR